MNTLLQMLLDALASSDRETDDRHMAIMNELATQRNLIMALSAEVQALHDAVAAQSLEITEATGELTKLEADVVDLKAKLAAVVPGVPVNPDDLAEIIASTASITASIANIKAAMPAPIPAPVVAAAADATSA